MVFLVFIFILFCFLLEKNKNSKNISVHFVEIIFFSLGRKEKTTMKMLSGSHMHYCWSKKDPILPCLLLWINICRFQLSLGHAHFYYYSHHSVMQVKGNNDDNGCNSTYFVFVNMISSSFLIEPIMNETCLQWQLEIIVTHAMRN